MFPVAFLDANVLVPHVRGDALLTAAALGLYEPALSSHVITEARRHLHGNGLRRIDMAAEYFADRFVTGYENAIPNMRLPRTPEDRHVLAAALAAGATFVVTDETDLATDVNALRLGLTAVTADGFLSHLDMLTPGVLDVIADAMAVRRRKPPQTRADMLVLLTGPHGFPRTAARTAATTGPVPAPGSGARAAPGTGPARPQGAGRHLVRAHLRAGKPVRAYTR